VAGYTTAQGAEWEYLGENAAGDGFLYDKESIVSDDKGVINGWIKLVYSEKGKQIFIEGAKKEDFYNIRHENISYTNSLASVNCSTREYGIIYFSHHNSEGHCAKAKSNCITIRT
jgi:hypothetical protein